LLAVLGVNFLESLAFAHLQPGDLTLFFGHGSPPPSLDFPVAARKRLSFRFKPPHPPLA
jgi:hypothetical protein